jgi:hypothetical protein
MASLLVHRVDVSVGCADALRVRADGQGRGSPRKAGFGGAIGVRFRRAPVGAETTWGSYLVDSAWSITAMRLRSASPSMGAVKTRAVGPPQLGQVIVSGAVPMGMRTSTHPSSAHRYV